MNKYSGQKKWKTGVVLFSIVLAVMVSQALWAAPKLAPSNAKAGDCAACHMQEKVLPENHPDTKDLNGEGCKACHKDALALTGKIPGNHVHQLTGMDCVKCHGKTKTPEALTMEQCVACHGSTDKLAEKTQNVKPTNPHTSPHYGTTLDCNLCHHQHAKSENYCSSCHQFDFKVP